MGWQGAPYKLGCGENRTSYILMYPEVELPWCFSIWGLEGSLPTRNSSWGSMLIGWMVTNCYQVTSILLTWLVVWNMLYFFPYLGNVIIPTDELTFFRGVGIPPTSYRFVLRIFLLLAIHRSYCCEHCRLASGCTRKAGPGFSTCWP